MMLKLTKPHNMMFYMVMFISILAALTSSTWIMLWMMMEINLMTITPLLMKKQKSYEMEASVKYFIIQTISSSLILLPIIFFMSNMLNWIMTWVFLTAILIKMGAAPCHMWIPPIMSNTSWGMIFNLSTWQKLTPLWMLIKLSSFWSTNLLIILTMLNAFVGSTGGINQTQLRPLMAYSSIAHMAWMLTSLSYSTSLTLIYFLTYSTILLSIMFMLLTLEINLTMKFSITSNTHQTFTSLMFLSILSLSGLPPLLGFAPKWLILSSIPHNLILQTTLIVSALISLFYYLNIFMASQLPNFNTKFLSPSIFIHMFIMINLVSTPFIMMM